jgi:CGNR zinc finger
LGIQRTQVGGVQPFRQCCGGSAEDGRGRASDLLRGRVLIEMYNAQLIGTWRRLKVCHNARCHEVFFDQSKNNSRTWFDTAACANALNLRAYRERRKAARFSDLSERDPG